MMRVRIFPGENKAQHLPLGTQKFQPRLLMTSDGYPERCRSLRWFALNWALMSPAEKNERTGIFFDSGGNQDLGAMFPDNLRLCRVFTLQADILRSTD